MQPHDTYKQQMSRFTSLLLRFASPFAALLILYICTDPFKVVWDYDAFYPEQVNGGVSLNPGYVGTQNYIKQAPRRQYDSFILGNSRSIYYPISSWQAILPKGSRCYHYDAAAESLMGIWQKLRLIERRHGQINNVLMVVDADLLQKTDCDHWHLCETAPQLAEYVNLADFHWYNFKTFITPKFFVAYVDYSLFHKLRPYMLEEHLLTEDMFVYDPITNECDFAPMERRIEAGTYYTDERLKVFEHRQFPDSTSPVVLRDRQCELLDSIHSVFQRHHTNVHIVISPLYDQIRINPADKAELVKRFSGSHIHDFSGPNRWNNDYHNYFEASHYRTHVCKEILDSIIW